MSCCVNIMTFMEASLNLNSDMQPFVEQLILIERLQVSGHQMALVFMSIVVLI